MAPERFEIKTGGATLVGERWRPSGALDGPTVVFLHAGVCDRRSWYGVCDALAGVADLVAYDRRGFGETVADTEPFFHLDDLLAIVGWLGNGAVWLVGNSMGGGLALDAAIAHPAAVAGLVLIAPAISGLPWGEVELDPDTVRLEAAIETARAAGDTESVNRLETHLWLDGPATAEGRVGGAIRQLALEMNALALASGLPEDAGASGVDAWNRLDAIRVPVTVTWGGLDLFMVEITRMLFGRLPDAARHEFAGMAHLPPLEDPAAVADVIRAALVAGEAAT
jgi:pimeloyl-ACP methyl ester carboxylesterase